MGRNWFVAGALAAALACSGAEAHMPGHTDVLASLCAKIACPNGVYSGSMAMDGNGDFFGFTGSGGVYHDGTAFELYRAPGTSKWKYQTIYNFCDSCGADGPGGQTPVVDAAGNVYGISGGGGSKSYGTFFKLTPPSKGKLWNLAVLYSFCTKDNACADGGTPYAALAYQGQSAGALYDGISTLYGLNEFGGVHGAGVVFSLTPRFGRWREHVLYPFCDGQSGCTNERINSVTVDHGGSLVGTNSGTYPNYAGYVARLSPNPGGRFWTETVLYNFCSQTGCSDGAAPGGTVTEDADGNLYGLASYGGNTNCGYSAGCGVLYKLAPDNTEAVLYQFCSRRRCADGSFPGRNLLLSSAGTFYGVTEGGGHDSSDAPDGAGVVFELHGSNYRTIWDFCLTSGCPDGAYPGVGLTAEFSGDLFGLTEGGGTAGDGTIFKLNR